MTMTETVLPEIEPTGTRTMVRLIAANMVHNKELPTGEKVRKRIGADTGGKMNPSALTVQDELKKWFADTFWPTHLALGTLPENTKVPETLRRLFSDSFQTIVVGAIDAAKSSWGFERDEYERRLAEANSLYDELTTQVGVFEQRAMDIQAKLEAQSEIVATAQRQNGADRQTISDLQSENARINVALQEAALAQAQHERALNEVRDAERQRADRLVEAARDDARRVRVDLDAERQSVKRLDAAVAGHQEKINATNDRAVKAEALLSGAKTEIAGYQEQISKLHQTIARLSEQNSEPTRKPLGGGARERAPKNRIRKNKIAR
jgi:hypothetical protein